MKKTLTYKRTFSRYRKSLSQKLAQTSYIVYKGLRIFISKIFPLTDYEQYRFQDSSLTKSDSTDMPKGYDYLERKEADGYVKLKYLDFFDYLPKEDVERFKKQLRHFVRSNKKYVYSSCWSDIKDDRIENMGRYVDGDAFSLLYTIEFAHDTFLAKYAPQIEISIRNLSPSFLIIKYRAFVSDAFNEELDNIYRAKYRPYNEFFKPLDVSWYKPNNFLKAMYRGDDARRKVLYEKTSLLKWKIYCGIKKNFKVYFANDSMFPPVFGTYSTNIRPSSQKDHHNFWDSIGLGDIPDYSNDLNICINWEEERTKNEGVVFSAYCGGNYKINECLPETAEYMISDTYSVYMVAESIRLVAEKDIATYNKKISKTVRKGKALSLLKLRSQVEQRLYYSYRFMSEFTGATIDKSDEKHFYNKVVKDSSITRICLEEIAKRVENTKKQIDVLLELLDDAAEFSAAKSNMALQWFMLVITLLSLLVAIAAISDSFPGIDVFKAWASSCIGTGLIFDELT